MRSKFSVWREQRVVLAVVNGSWDRTTAEEYAAEFRRQAAPLLGSDWAHIVYLDQWQLGVPEIEPVIQHLVQWCISNQLRYAAQIYCPHMVKMYQLERMIVDRTDAFERRVYPTEAGAFAWLAEKGFQMDTLSLVQKAS